jgi:hypothetical protein
MTGNAQRLQVTGIKLRASLSYGYNVIDHCCSCECVGLATDATQWLGAQYDGALASPDA